MKLSRIVLLVAAVIVIVVVALFAYETFLAPRVSSPWLSAASYPLQIEGAYAVAAQQCVATSSRVYCIGGLDANSAPRSEIYSSSPSSSSPNLTSWTLDSNAYPTIINSQSCVAASNSYVYCVGGSYDDSGDDVATSYFAPVNSSGLLGAWTNTTAYPIPVDTESCVSSSSYIYCVGGYNETDGTYGDSVMSNAVWFANLSSSGIGTWKETTPYPSGVYLPSCVSSAGYVYCVGGSDINSNPLNNVYYAALSSSGVGTWSATTNYPASLSGQACITSSAIVYCVGGQGSGSSSYSNAIYYATLSDSGISAWKQVANYPNSVATDCAVYSEYLYCVGGIDGSSQGENANVYYDSISSVSG